jgi:hypothetical protein
VAVRGPSPHRSLACRVHASLGAITRLYHPSKLDRSRIDISDTTIAKRWVKRPGKSKDEIAAAIAKIDDNAETVIKELRFQRKGQPQVAQHTEVNFYGN